MDIETVNLPLPSEPLLKSARGLKIFDENFVWVAVAISVLAHIGTIFILKRDTIEVPQVEVKKPAAKVRILANPNGNPNSQAKAVEIAKPLPKPKVQPKPNQRVIATKPVEKEEPVTEPVENSGPQSFGDDTTGGVVGEGFSTTDGESDADVVANAEPIERINPAYPKEAQLKGIEGYVIIRCDINEEGRAENIQVLKAEPRNLFEKDAKAAVRKWQYKPRIVNGVPVKMIGKEVRFDFTLPQG